MRVAVLGLGEAGSIYAADLAARGAVVRGTDPHVSEAPAGVMLAPDIADAVADADVVLSLVRARAAASVIDEALEAMGPSSIFVDMNTCGPEYERALAAKAAAKDVAFVDAAIMAPVLRSRLQTPLLLSGTGAARLQPLLEELGVAATDVGDEAGVAASLKLLRSVFMKGLAALIFESATAARTLDAEDWILDQISTELGDSGPDLVQRLLDGTPLHAVRREAEMRDVRAFLESIDAPHPMTDGTIQWLHAMAEKNSTILRS
jgi:3-hydroxyisobutyrate dehydrogenase-like beta-hydroxyacid dehydrogenase